MCGFIQENGPLDCHSAGIVTPHPSTLPSDLLTKSPRQPQQREIDQMQPHTQWARDLQHNQGELQKIQGREHATKAQDKENPQWKVGCRNRVQQHTRKQHQIKRQPERRVAHTEDQRARRRLERPGARDPRRNYKKRQCSGIFTI